MCQSSNCECEVRGAKHEVPLDHNVLGYSYVIPPGMFTLSYAQYTYAIDRQLEEMKRALYHTAIGMYRESERQAGKRVEYTRE